MYAIFGTLENLCEMDENARALLKNKKPISIGFEVFRISFAFISLPSMAYIEPSASQLSSASRTAAPRGAPSRSRSLPARSLTA